VQGGLGCDPASGAGLEARQGSWAAVAGAAPAIRDAGGVLARARAAGARLVVVADRAPGAHARVEEALRRAGANVLSLDPADLAAAEATMRRAATCDAAAVVALSACTRGARPSAPFTVAAARCNRCGACLSLGCPAISDPGGEAMAVDPATCTGCGLCAPLCRGRAIGPR
jgi:TPP-dependent indolepyruvate ferredoxin oxidoreductase alpha subunit